jgi:tetratricopeptide (TPR) repeat protein
MLYDLAKAYSKLGMDDQTARTYQYIFEVSGESEQERIYLPMIQSLAAAGRTIEVEEYADRYQLRYPKGLYQPAIFLLKARALYDSGQLDKAIKLLTAPGSPRQPQVELLKGRIFYDLKQWQQAIDTLAQPRLQELLAQSSLLLPLAESYFQVGQGDQAAPLFRRIIEQQGTAAEQAQFRMAQIEAKKNNSLQALNLFKEIAEKGKDPLWTKLAREEVAIFQLRQQ